MMKCGCKKTYCSTKTCKCKKNGSSCSDGCSCTLERCKNREVADPAAVNPEAANPPLPLENPVSWQDVLTGCDESREVLSALSRLNFVPDPVREVFRRRQKEDNELKLLLTNFEHLAIEARQSESLTEDQWKDYKARLVKCASCDRKFDPTRVKKHEEICKRKTFVVNNNTTTNDTQ